jgi:hypothetical protein
MRKILKGAVVLLIVAAMFFSTTAVTADDEETPQSELGKNSQPQNIQSSPYVSSRGLLWDNGDPDFVNGLSCSRIGAVGLSELADDFHLEKKTTVQQLVWETVDDTTYSWDGTDDLIIYEYTNEGPGTEIVKILEVQNTREYLGEQFGRPWYRYEIDLEAQGQTFNLAKGDYFILLRPYTAGNAGSSYWLTAPTPAGSTSECYFRSEYFGILEWTPATDMWGDPYDVNFKIFGTQDFSREINRPILNFLSNHLNLFPLLQLFLQNLGL